MGENWWTRWKYKRKRWKEIVVDGSTTIWISKFSSLKEEQMENGLVDWN